MRSYIGFIAGLHSELVEALRGCELLEMHHADPGSGEYLHYQRVMTWIAEVEERLIRYGNTDKRIKARIREAAKLKAIGDVGGSGYQYLYSQW